MKHVNLEELRALLPDDWEERAAVALQAVRSTAADQRSQTIDRYSGLWRELGAALKSLGNGKCWYCESREDRSDKSIDHFRPKNSVAESPDHPGYWWLAFAWINYRYSCTYCNSRRRGSDRATVGGKHDHFPLVDEAARVFNEGSTDAETPVLLDPARDSDTTLLYFREDGVVSARFREDHNRLHWKRAEASVDLYHLNHEDVVEARRELHRQIKRILELGKIGFADQQTNNAAAAATTEYAVGELRGLLDRGSEFSAAARDMISGFRDNSHPWIDAI